MRLPRPAAVASLRKRGRPGSRDLPPTPAASAALAAETPPVVPAVRRASVAVFLSFGQGGFVFSTWASRIPQVQDDLHLSPGALGLVLTAVAVGSTVSVPLSGLAIRRFGDARVVAAMSLLVSAGLGVVALTAQQGPVGLAIGLVLLGFGIGMWDVALNVQGTTIERRLERAALARFYAGSSIGTALGAAIGVLILYLGVPLTVHLGGVAIITALTAPFVTRMFVTGRPPGSTAGGRRQRGTRPRVTGRTALLGLLVLCMALSEGAGNDWIGVAMIDGYSVSVQAGTTTFAVFLIAMTCTRWFGPVMIDRFGRTRTLICVLSLGMLGLAMVIFGQVFVVAMCGAALWGIGTSLGMPIGLSAAAEHGATNAVTTVASVGYLAFLAGPPLIGFLANWVGPLHSLLLIEAMFVVALMLVPVVAPKPGDTRGASNGKSTVAADDDA